MAVVCVREVVGANDLVHLEVVDLGLAECVGEDGLRSSLDIIVDSRQIRYDCQACISSAKPMEA